MKRLSRGYTLFELIIVIGLLGIGAVALYWLYLVTVILIKLAHS